MTSVASVLNVLPHPGGGGEAYVEALAAIEGYRSRRLYLATDVTPTSSIFFLPRSFFYVRRAVREHSLLHVHGEVAGAICLPLLATRASVVTLHGLHLLRRLSGARRAAAGLNLRLIVRAASRTICVSDSEHADLLSVVGPQAARRVTVIYNGVPPVPAPSAADRAAIRAELGIPQAATVGALVGALDEHKDPMTAVRAAIDTGAGGGFVLLILGDGPMRPQLERLAASQGGRAVRLLGQRKDVRRVLSGADFFVLPSKREGLSFALLEALALGLPAVVSDGPGNPEAIGNAGIVVPCGDRTGFAAAFARMHHATAARAMFSAEARARAEHRFSAARMLSGTRRVYDEVLRERARLRPSQA